MYSLGTGSTDALHTRNGVIVIREIRMSHRATVFIADDHEVFLRDLRRVVRENIHLQLVGEASDGKVAWTRILALEPEIVLLDNSMPGLTGLEVAARIEAAKLSTKVVLVTAHKEESLFNGALDLGVQGFVLKDDYVTDLPQALRSISHSKRFFSPAVLPFLNHRNQRCKHREPSPASLETLTPRELKVLRLVADQLRNNMIARQLSRSSESIAEVRTQLVSKLDLQDEDELAQFASEHREELVSLKVIPRDFT